jgi:hypothetical protein
VKEHFEMGSLGEEDLEKLVLDYIESPITVSQHIESSTTALITLKVSTYLFSPNTFSLFFSG